MPSEMEDYLFDLHGYLLLRNAVNAVHLAELNDLLDTHLDMQPDEWRGHIHRPTKPTDTVHLHNLFEMGEPFERLIDHPAWLAHMERYVGGDDGLFIDESFADVREESAATRMHSGAHKRRIRTQFRYHDGQFRCGQINILLALNDIGPDDGPTMVVPGSHKSNLLHPAFRYGVESLDGVEAAIKVPLGAGDAAFFVDCLAHGSAQRINSGQRRVLIIRYGPHWGNDRYGYQPSDRLLARLTPQQLRIVQPLPPLRPPDDRA